jgi:excinuclease UvrABC nuclease subunit
LSFNLFVIPAGNLRPRNLESDTREATQKFKFERAAKLRDQVKDLRTKEFLFS